MRGAQPQLHATLVEGGTLLTLVRSSQAASGGRRQKLLDYLHLRPLALGQLPAVYSYELETPTQAELDDYNRKLEAFRPVYEEYIVKRDLYESFPLRSFTLELLLRNSGGRPAEEVELSLQLPNDVVLVNEDDIPVEPDVPAGPKLPGRPRGIRAMMESINKLSSLNSFHGAMFAQPEFSFPALRVPKNVADPEFTTGVLRFRVRVLSNFDQVQLPACVLSFPRTEDVRSITIPYRLRSHSLPHLLEGELHVRVDRAPVSDAPEGDVAE